MSKSTDGIEKGSYSTSGVNDEIDEPKQRGGDGSAVMGKSATFAHPRTELAHKKPMAG